MLTTERPSGLWIDRIRAEYLEMPGLSLTRTQMRRLWQLGEAECDEVVDALVATGFLRHLRNQTYVKGDDDL